MDTAILTRTRKQNQEPPSHLSETLSPSDRRLLLSAALSLYLRRLRHGQEVTSDDLIRASRYGDPNA
jgi:hypothetical protein